MIIKYNELDYLKEDMFQAEYQNLILDVGYYGDGFIKLEIIKDYDWESPLESISFRDASLIQPLIEVMQEKIVSGFFSGKYIVNNGYQKD
ncbi:hypothetical protein OAN96_00900 [Candidatus Gracilibacteria bacterium]|nr:hypothetical protein [Candidatus Gracilibacteria bacterium]